ncbi:MAG: stage II sporulation protein M [Acetanaerobacterium sp.]
MRRTTFSRAGKGRSRLKEAAKFLTEHRLVYAVFVLFAVGILAGSLAVRHGGEAVLGELDRLMGNYIAKRAEQLFLPSFLSSFTVNFLVLLAVFFLGFCAIAPPVILLASTARGFSIGVSIGYLYSSAGFDGMAFAAQHLVPAAVISSFVLILACASSYKLSGVYFSLFSRGVPDSTISDAAGACLTKYIVYTLLIFLSAVVDGACCSMFGAAV